MRLWVKVLIGSQLAAWVLTLGSCSWQKEETDIKDKSVKVQIPVAVNGRYELGVVELYTLKNLTNLEGLAARFLIDPQTIKGFLKGRSPKLRYMRDSDGVIIAKDALSLQLLSVYAHFEKLKELDDKSGAAGVLKFPRRVAVNVRYKSPWGEIQENNALYSREFDALFVQPFTMEDLPLMANPGVIGHEHFHALFQKLVIEPMKGKYPDPARPTIHNQEKFLKMMGLEPLPVSSAPAAPAKEDPRTLYHSTLLRGINEGLADVWGWLYSGDSNFVARSLRNEKMRRDLDILPEQLFSPVAIQNPILNGANENELLGIAYLHGHQLSGTIRNFANIYARERGLTLQQVRPQVGEMLVALLPELRKSYEGLKENEYLSLSTVVHLFAKQVKNLKTQECAFLAKLMPVEYQNFPVQILNEDRRGLEKQCRDLQNEDKP